MTEVNGENVLAGLTITVKLHQPREKITSWQARASQKRAHQVNGTRETPSLFKIKSNIRCSLAFIFINITIKIN